MISLKLVLFGERLADERQTPDEHCWVLGDNQKKSGDSGNNLGAIPLKNIVSKVLWRAGPEGWNWVEHGVDCIPKKVSVATHWQRPVILSTEQLVANSTKPPGKSGAIGMYQRPKFPPDMTNRMSRPRRGSGR